MIIQKYRGMMLGLLLGISSIAVDLPMGLAETGKSEDSEQFQIEIDGEVVENATYILTPSSINEAMEQGNYEVLKQHVKASIASINIEDESLPSIYTEYIAQILTTLGHININLGLYDEAEQAFQRSLLIQNEKLKSTPSETKGTKYSLANLYTISERYNEAKSLYIELLPIYERDLGGEHPDVAIILHLLAITNIELNLEKEAIPLLERALAIQEKKLESNDPQITAIRDKLSSLYQKNR